jgi:hypothetical protein
VAQAQGACLRRGAHEFQVTNGCLEAVGHVVLNAPGLPQPLQQDGVTMPVQSINGKSVGWSQGAQTDQAGADDLTMAQAGGCNILNLVLGPLHLNLLGLVVDLKTAR